MKRLFYRAWSKIAPVSHKMHIQRHWSPASIFLWDWANGWLDKNKIALTGSITEADITECFVKAGAANRG